MKNIMLLRLLSLGILVSSGVAAQAGAETVYELRTYTTHEGKLSALNERFVNHTLGYFEKHGMQNIGYWIPTDPDLSENTLIYIVAHESEEAAKNNWQSFSEDPGWQKAYTDSREDGPIVKNIESIFMNATDYSKIR